MPARLPSMRQPPVGFAHRGARAHAPENTVEAFALALRLGATGLESDVWLTADGEAVLDHDGRVGGRLRRTPIRSVAAADLPPHLPTLAGLYEACGTGFELSLDVKDPAALDRVLAVARAAGDGVEARLWLCHGDWPTVASWRGAAPAATLVHSTRLGALAGGPEAHAARMADAGVEALNLRHTEWTGGRTTLLHRFGRLALAWGCQHERTLREVLDAGIDAVYSDHVDRMVEAIDRLGGHGP